jgi:hypothetical protein
VGVGEIVGAMVEYLGAREALLADAYLYSR